MRRVKKRPGLVLTELLVSTGILAVLFGLGSIVFGSFSTQDQMSLAVGRVTAAVDEARARCWANYSEDGAQGSYYGVYFNERSVVIFPGQTYNENNPANQSFDLPRRIYVDETGFINDAIIFAPLTGEVFNYDSGNSNLVLADDHSQFKATIGFNSLGVATIEKKL